MEKAIANTRLYLLLGFNIVLILVLGHYMLKTLKTEVANPPKTEEKAKQEQPKPDVPQQKAKPKEPPATTTVTDVNPKDNQDTTVKNTTEQPKEEKRTTTTVKPTGTEEKKEKEVEQSNNTTNKSKTGIGFLVVIYLMLLSGGMGGVLCNLRGFFIHFRSAEASFPDNLEIPYYVRPFMSAGAGLFIYFVVNFLVTSISIEYTINDVPFQALVSFVALAMLAGFGSLEFFQRLKETAMALFGQKAEKDRWQRLEELHKLFKAEILSQVEYDKEKEKILNSASEPENMRAAKTPNSTDK